MLKKKYRGPVLTIARPRNLEAIDQAAQAAGLSRSAWIKAAINAALLASSAQQQKTPGS